MILLVAADSSVAVVEEIERAVRRAGGDPSRLTAGGELAIAARGADPARLGRPEGVRAILRAASPYPRAARDPEARTTHTTVVRIGDVPFGGREVVLVAGPCAVESPEQVDACARAVAAAGGRVLRGGAWKPRSSPYAFQGHGETALVWLADAARRHGLAVVSEVLDPATVPTVAAHVDALQIGSRNMQNAPLLRAAGRSGKPVLLKRGMSATLDEWLLAAEYVLDAGNPHVVLCERGVRSFDPAARNLLDLAAVPLLRARTHLPIVVDPSHGVGVRSAVAPMALAAIAAGADGVLVECHPDPGRARSDAYQALDLDELASLGVAAATVARAVGRSLER